MYGAQAYSVAKKTGAAIRLQSPFLRKIMAVLKKNILLGAVLTACLGFSSLAMAGSDDKPGSGANPFSDCGIGAAIFPETNWAAVTSNVTWDLGSTAITSATLSPGTCSSRKVASALFIRDTYTRLVEDSAKGEGEYLATALNLFECSGAQHQDAIQEVRAAMGPSIIQAEYQGKTHLEKSSDFYNIINNAAKNNCGA
jgi:hypothetical protein